MKDKPRATVEPSRWVKHKNVCLYNSVVPPVGEKQFMWCYLHLVVRKDMCFIQIIICCSNCTVYKPHASTVFSLAMTEVEPVLDFASSGRSGRRNALPDILGSPVGVPPDLPLKLAELSLTGNSFIIVLL